MLMDSSSELGVSAAELITGHEGYMTLPFRIDSFQKEGLIPCGLLAILCRV